MRKLIMGLLVGLLMFSLSAKQYAKYYDMRDSRKSQEIERQIAEKLYEGWTIVFMVPINQGGSYGCTSALLVIYDDGK